MTRTILLAAALPLLAGPTAAIELTNGQPKPQPVFVTEEADGATQEVTLAPGQTIDHLCKIGCILDLDNGELLSLEGHEKVELKDGSFTIVK